ncbi:MAG: NupC/NupG family nucleoside CNT transporter [Ignavibacteriales bacterium]
MFINSLLRGILGILVIIGLAFLFSNNKRRINWRLVLSGLLLQVIFAILVIKGNELGSFFAPLAWPKRLLEAVGYGFVLILGFTSEGAKFVFGPLAIGPGNPSSLGMIFAFQVLPTIIFFACLMSLMYYFGIMQKVVQGMAWVMAKVMGTSGAESLSCTANIFVGQTEAPLMIKPYIKGMTQSELLTLMIGGMAHIAGGVMAAYVQILGQAYSQTMNVPLQQAQIMFATHFLAACTMATPAGMLIAKIIFPETEESETKGEVKVPVEKNAANFLDAAAVGASDGLMLALNVGAMLIAFIALIALANYLFQGLGEITGLNRILMANFHQPLNLQLLLGLTLQYLALAIGVPWNSAMQFGSLIGTKLVLNEFVAYVDMAKMIELKQMLDTKSILMATYAVCGFANFSSIAIQIGGISPLAPKRRSDIAKLGIKAVIGGSLATLMTATLGGILF